MSNQWKKKRLSAGNLPPDIARAEQMGRCPGGHKLPHRGEKGECSPLYCTHDSKGGRGKKTKEMSAEVRAKRTVLRRLSMEGDEQLNALLPKGDKTLDAVREEAAEEKELQVSRLAKAVGRLAARRAFLKVPVGLKGADAEEWVLAQATEASVDAFAELQYQLKLGDENQRMKASEAILDMVGMRKKESGGGHGATIQLFLGGGNQLPWAPQKVVEGSVTIKADEKK